LTAPAAFFSVYDITSFTLNLVYSISVTGFGRASELQSDDYGLELLIDAGYDPKEALKFFDVMLKEKSNYRKGIEIYYLSSHPSNVYRKKGALKWLEKNPEKHEALEAKPNAGFQDLMYDIRRENTAFNLDLNRYYHALDEAKIAAEQRPDDPVAQYYLGEVYRNLPGKWLKIQSELTPKRLKEIKKGKKKKDIEKEWLKKAKESYQRSIELDLEHSLSYKGLGKLYLLTEEPESAKEQFNKYLILKPMAKDKRSVLRYLRDIDKMLLKEVQVNA